MDLIWTGDGREGDEKEKKNFKLEQGLNALRNNNKQTSATHVIGAPEGEENKRGRKTSE